ncbi:hypothetical protein VTL71DRAFT_4694 [Oculimacula yallundae]|uniref:Uncharacterized protein n=1 Tax=Oculimacula yallundae TaxID=86028 RepID=A0ABR4C2Q8_9HELO
MEVPSLLTPELLAELRESLKQDWFITERDDCRLQLEYIWSPPSQHYPDHRLLHKMLQLSSIQDPQNRRRRIPYVDTWQEDQFYNKATVLYWTQSAIDMMHRLDGPVILGGIWNIWSEALGREPQIQLDEFFAVPVSVGEQYAKTLPGILRSHEAICAQVRKTVADMTSPGATAKSRNLWPDLRYSKLYPLCEALIAVFDEYRFVAAEKHAVDGLRHFADVIQEQSIILIRTGHEIGLSAPISFSSLKDKALPLARREKLGFIDAIRVPLQTGVRFVADLLLREEAAFPDSNVAGHLMSREADHPVKRWERKAHDYAEEELALAKKEDKIKPFATAEAVRKRVLSHRVDLHPPEWYAPYTFKLGWI